MRIIITGGTGLIGRPFSAELVKRGHEVTVLSRDPIEADPMPEGVFMHRWDGRTADGWGHLVEGADALINLAGANMGAARWSKKRKALIRDSRINAGSAVMEAIREAAVKPKVLIQASAIGYYGGDNGGTIAVEKSPLGDDFMAKVCFDWEMSTAPASHMGVRRPIIRTGVVLSNDGGAFTRLELPFKFFVGGKLGDGSQWFSWIHMRDQIRAMIFVLENEEVDGPINLVAPNPVTNQELAKSLGDAMGRPSAIPAPSFAIKTLLGEMSDMVLKGPRVLPRNLEDMGFEFEYPTIEQALDELVGEADSTPQAVPA
jgi:uncharacterized protein (TIGR01777 family)